MQSLGNFLLEMREENKDEMETTIKTTYIGDIGELFALNYLKKLFERNNINYNVNPHNYDKEDFDLEIYGNGRSYKVEVKFSTSNSHPIFHQIHFNNNFDFLFLIYHPSDDEIYFAILTKEEAKEIATPENTNREYEDNWAIHRISIFNETNENFLNRLSEFLELNMELEDLDDEDKLSLIEDAKEEVTKKHKDAQINDFDGETYQEWIYNYLNNFTNDAEPMEYGDEYDIKYKGKHIEIKYSSTHYVKTSKFFMFKHIKPNLFHFIFFIGFDTEENKFYFSIKTSEEVVEIKRETTESDKFYSQNGFTLNVGKHSILNFVNDFTFEDFDNYIESY